MTDIYVVVLTIFYLTTPVSFDSETYAYKTMEACIKARPVMRALADVMQEQFADKVQKVSVSACLRTKMAAE